MVEIRESSRIRGVRFVRLQEFRDERGRFLETFRKEWFPERRWDVVQANWSESRQGVLRGLHYHFRQVDYWYPAAGKIRIALVDLRKSSPTRLVQEVLDVAAEDAMGVFVPVGVAHGFHALTDATLTYLVDGYYDNSDELGVAWNDPALKVGWGVENAVLSPRDQANPLLKDIPERLMPE